MTNNKRGAGVLLHITSLPSAFGIGDVGPEAKLFADFLRRSRQKYWQFLPINPTEQGQGHSPYSSISSRAGNTLLISPELLEKEGLLYENDVKQYYLPRNNKTNYSEAERVKTEIFALAWKNFQQQSDDKLHTEFKEFCLKEAYWLDDFSLYMLLKQQNESKPWFQWSDEYKHRDKQALQKLSLNNEEQTDKVKWLQFIFAKQWNELRAYCHHLDIHFFGDLPFYVSYDSADVWSHPDLFSLDKEGNMIGVAGVPPDAFSNDGQLWGMPVFLWNVHKEQQYAWWIERFKKNIELFDLLRLDHFRAFADYWEVPASSDTAKYGQWKPGPGEDLFNAVKKELGYMPFIAEDLGEIDAPVYELRDKFHFPGMKVLQFAFGHDMPQSQFIPHNYSENFVAYTGTHDNNTIVGWYRHEGKNYHHQLTHYCGMPVTEENVHLIMGRLIYGSVAKLAILPMQDVLGLDESARMNTPASGDDNWQWRLLPDEITHDIEKQLKEWAILYNRT